MAKKNSAAVGIAELREELKKLQQSAITANAEYHKIVDGLTKEEAKKYNELKLNIKAMNKELAAAQKKMFEYEEKLNSAKGKDDVYKNLEKELQPQMKKTLANLQNANAEVVKLDDLFEKLARDAKKVADTTKDIVPPSVAPSNNNTSNNPTNNTSSAPNPNDWKEWNAEVNKAIAYIEKIRIETRGLSAEQEEQLGDLVNSLRRGSEGVKGMYESERAVSRAEHDFITSSQQAANAIKVEVENLEKLNRARDKASTDLDKFIVKNEDIINSNESLSQALGMLRQQFSEIGNAADMEQYKVAFEAFKQTVKETTAITKKAAADSKALALAQASEVATLATTIRTKIVDGLYRFALQQIRAIVSATEELDERLVEIRKVTDFSDNELKDFVSNIKSIGQATATTTSELLEASAVFARSGYTREQIEMLTEEAAVLKNVSDGISDMSQASEVLISIMKAYKVPAEEARTITDQLNNISNNAAISFDDLAEGISRVGSVLAAQNTSIGQLSAMLTGANEVLQNIEKTSNGLKTISQRLRSIDAEMSGDVLGTAKLQSLFDSVIEKYGETVRITDEATGQLRGTYDILQDLAKVWNKLTSNEQQLLGEKIAGKNQITVLQALLGNWQSVERAVENVENATGSAAKEQENYKRSLTGSVDLLKSALQNMYQGAIDPEFLSGIVRMLTEVVKIVDRLGIGNIAIASSLAGIIGKITVIRDRAGMAVGSFESIVRNLDSSQTPLQNFVNLLNNSAVNVSKLAAKFLETKTLTGQIGVLTEAETKHVHKLIELAAEGNLKFTDRIALSKLAARAQDHELQQIGAEVALQSTLNTLKSIFVGLATTAVGIIGIKIVGAIRNAIEAEKMAVNTAIDGLHDINDGIKNTQSQIDDIYRSIDEAGGAVTQGQLDNIKELELELEKLHAQQRAQQEEAAAAIDRKTHSELLPVYDNGEIVETVDRIYTYIDEATKKSITVHEQALRSFLDNSGNLLEGKYDEAMQYLASHSIDAIKEVRDYAGEDASIILEAYEALENAVKEKMADIKAEQEKIISQGVSKETLAEAFENILGDFDTDEVGEFWNKLVENADFSDTIKLTDELNISVEDLIKQLTRLNNTNVDRWQKEYSEIANVERKLSEYSTLYNQAVNGVKGTELLNIIDNWDKYADVLDVENGQLTINKELVVAKAKATIEATKAKLIAERDELAADIALAESELSLRKAAAESAKGQIQDANQIIGAKKGIIAANNAIIAGERGSLQDIGRLTSQVNALAKGSSYAAMSTAELEKAIANMKKRYADLNAQIAALENLDIEALLERAANAAKKGGKATKEATKAVNELEEALKSLKEVLSELERQMSDTTDVYEKIQEAMKDIIDAEIEALENENDAIEDNMNYYRARLQLIIEAIEREIEALEAEQEAAEDAYDAQIDALDAEIDALKKRTEEYEEQNKAEQDAIDEQIEALKQQQQAIDDVVDAKEKELEMEQLLLDIEKARLAAEKARDAYEAAKRAKTVRTYDAERGWIWTANQKDVESAYNSYTSAQANYEKLLQDYADKLAQAEIEAQKDAIQQQIDALEAQKDALQELLETTKEAAKAEEESIEEAIAALEAEKDAALAAYEAQIAELEAQTDHLEGIEDSVERAVDKYLNDQGVLDWVEAWMNASEEERAAMEDELAGMWEADREHQIANEEQIDELNEILQQIADMLKVTDEVLESQGVKDWLEAFANGDFAEREEMIKEMRDSYLEFYTHQQEEIKKIQEQIAKIEGSINYTNELLENWGTGEHYTPKNSYAQGGVVDSGLLTSTGMLSDRVKVHGTPTTPELILNGRQQANLLYQLAKQIPSVTSKGITNSSQSMYIATLNITADSQDTLRNLLIEAKQLASVS